MIRTGRRPLSTGGDQEGVRERRDTPLPRRSADGEPARPGRRGLRDSCHCYPSRRGHPRLAGGVAARPIPRLRMRMTAFIGHTLAASEACPARIALTTLSPCRPVALSPCRPTAGADDCGAAPSPTTTASRPRRSLNNSVLVSHASFPIESLGDHEEIQAHASRPTQRSRCADHRGRSPGRSSLTRVVRLDVRTEDTRDSRRRLARLCRGPRPQPFDCVRRLPRPTRARDTSFAAAARAVVRYSDGGRASALIGADCGVAGAAIQHV